MSLLVAWLLMQQTAVPKVAPLMAASFELAIAEVATISKTLHVTVRLDSQLLPE